MLTDAPDATTAVFATTHSIQVIAATQQAGLMAFDLIVCDEADRTTDVTTGEEDVSNSAWIRDDPIGSP